LKGELMAERQAGRLGGGTGWGVAQDLRSVSLEKISRLCYHSNQLGQNLGLINFSKK